MCTFRAKILSSSIELAPLPPPTLPLTCKLPRSHDVATAGEIEAFPSFNDAIDEDEIDSTRRRNLRSS
jgi:hypothetical protein